jgi:hypothetical protein
VSIPPNLAEGTRHPTPGYIFRVETALAEHAELETEMLLSERVGYVQPADMAAFTELATQVGELGQGLLRSLQTRLQVDQSADGVVNQKNHKRLVRKRAKSEMDSTNPKSRIPNPDQFTSQAPAALESTNGTLPSTSPRWPRESLPPKHLTNASASRPARCLCRWLTSCHAVPSRARRRSDRGRRRSSRRCRGGRSARSRSSTAHTRAPRDVRPRTCRRPS